jgi:diaminopimelate epimerase
MSTQRSARSLAFVKMHGAGNDFVLLDAIQGRLPKDLEAFARRLGDRHFGVGFDQMLVVRRSDVADFRMQIFNPDGSQVEMCANGIRAFFHYLRDHGHTDCDEVGVETLSGVVRPRWAGPGLVTVDMARPVLAPARIPTRLGSGEGPVLDVTLEVPAALSPDGNGRVVLSSLSMGNPHAVVVVDDVDTAPVHELGSFLEHHPAFPKRVNVEFAQILGRRHIRQRTWERGTGETLACGSGACAVAVSAMLRGVVDAEVEIELRGGSLQIGWSGGESHVFMTGPAAEVFRGEIPLTPEETLED